MTTFRGFDTQADALTFKKFIESIGYENISLSRDDQSKLFRVYYSTQCNNLEKLQMILRDIVDARPLDSGNDEEEEIWNTIDDLKESLKNFLSK